MKKFKNEFIGLCSGFFWAVNGTVLSLLMGSKLLKSYNVGVIFLLPLVFAGFNDLFAGLFVLGYNGIFGKLNRILPRGSKSKLQILPFCCQKSKNRK